MYLQTNAEPYCTGTSNHNKPVGTIDVDWGYDGYTTWVETNPGYYVTTCVGWMTE